MYKLRAFGSRTLPHVDPVQDQSARPARTDLIELPGGGVYDAHGSDADPDGQATATKSAAISAYDDAAVRAELDALRALVGTRDRLWREAYDTGELQWCLARFSRMPAVRRFGDRWRLAVDMAFDLVSPVWYGADETPEIVDPWDEDDDDLCTCGAQGLASGSAVTLHLPNGGNKTVTEIVITLSAIGGSATALTITSATTGHSFSWSGTLGSGKDLVIDTGQLSILNDGASAYVDFTPPSNRARWMEIAAGDNVWTVTVTGTDYVLLVEYADGWA